MRGEGRGGEGRGGEGKGGEGKGEGLKPSLAVDGVETEVKGPQQYQVAGEHSDADHTGTNL